MLFDADIVCKKGGGGGWVPCSGHHTPSPPRAPFLNSDPQRQIIAGKASQSKLLLRNAYVVEDYLLLTTINIINSLLLHHQCQGCFFAYYLLCSASGHTWLLSVPICLVPKFSIIISFLLFGRSVCIRKTWRNILSVAFCIVKLYSRGYRKRKSLGGGSTPRNRSRSPFVCTTKDDDWLWHMFTLGTDHDQIIRSWSVPFLWYTADHLVI